MSNGFWRTAKRTEPFSPGKCASERVAEYVATWQRRCYFNGIPDQVPPKVEASGRAPSWKALAVALLQNDLNLYRLGFAKPCWERQQQIIKTAHIAVHGTPPNYTQLELFNDYIR